ncbi:MAG: hypothetical protein Q8P67_03470 [archaeon]|nr:hypothetical protein [archaeon]
MFTWGENIFRHLLSSVLGTEKSKALPRQKPFAAQAGKWRHIHVAHTILRALSQGR